MIETNADLVNYQLRGSQVHTQICLDLAAGGIDGNYSLSGNSAKYPALPLAPPAHIGCHSMLVPLHWRKQETGNGAISFDRRQQLSSMLRSNVPRE